MENIAIFSTIRKVSWVRIILLGVALLMVWGAGLVQAAQNRPAGEPGAKPALFDVYLYFAGPGSTHLKAETRQFPASEDAHRMGRMLLDALMAGPSAPGLTRTFPKGTRVNALFITAKGDAYVDIETDMAGQADTISEYLAIYSLVNTLAVNINKVRQVRILVNGAEEETLGGHISLVPFYKTNMLIVN